MIDVRIYQPDEDGKKKYEYLQNMMLKAMDRGVIFKTVLMDTWYVITRIIQWINKLTSTMDKRSGSREFCRFTFGERIGGKSSYHVDQEIYWRSMSGML